MVEAAPRPLAPTRDPNAPEAAPEAAPERKTVAARRDNKNDDMSTTKLRSLQGVMGRDGNPIAVAGGGGGAEKEIGIRIS